MKYNDGDVLPERCILSLKMPAYGHWLLYDKGKFYDPEFGVSDRLPDKEMLRDYWEIVE